jgi:ABC-type transport system involved in multi-copper enzyme maturation permease subunit
MRKVVAIAYNEVLLNSKRIAPYALMILFFANAVLWWLRPAVLFGWATNSDWYIVRNLLAFSFLLGMPLFNAVIMGDPVSRDFRTEIDPLIFSKPITRAQYLVGKFVGNFLVLVCCQAVFPLTQMVLQLFPTSRMIVLPIRVFPYFKHFLFFLVITHLALAAFYFSVGTLTRNSKIVYGLAIALYPLYIAFGLLLIRPLPDRWRLTLDPLLLGASLRGNGFLQTAEFLNNYVVAYTAGMVANRMGMVAAAVGCFALLYLRFSAAEGSRRTSHASLAFSSVHDQRDYGFDSMRKTQGRKLKGLLRSPFFSLPAASGELNETLRQRRVSGPSGYADGTNVIIANEGIRANVNKLVAAIGMEFRLLRAERSLVVVMPLAIFVCLLEIAFYPIHAEVSLSAAYAGNTATSLLIFLIGLAVFYTGEAMHRDRELRIQPFLWSTPVANYVLILSKFFSTLLLLCGLIVSLGIAAVAIQVIRQHTPVDLIAYLRVYGMILLPSAFILTALSVLGAIALRNKYAFYVISIGTAAGLFYLYSNGYNHWVYNPLMYRLWTYSDLTVNARAMVIYRLTWMAISLICLAVAHLFFDRRSRRKAYLPLPFALR